MTSPYVIHHDGTERFALPAERMWHEMVDIERFESWWPWLRDLRVTDGGVVTGGRVHLGVVSPLPHRLHVQLEFVDVIEGRTIAVSATGDLTGTATLDLRAIDAGACEVDLVLDLEPTQAPMRLLVRIARPVIVRAMDWAIDIALRNFRRRVEGVP